MLRINLNFFPVLKEIEATQLRRRNEARLQQAKKTDGNAYRCPECGNSWCGCSIPDDPYPREEA